MSSNNALCDDMPSGIKMVHWNVCSMCPTGDNTTLDQLKMTLSSGGKTCHVLGITETWLNHNYGDGEILINGYHRPLRKDRANKGGGGVLMYIQEMYGYVRRADLEDDNLEAIWAEIKCQSGKPLLICTVYRPPNEPLTAWLDAFDIIIAKAFLENKSLLIMGDLNVNDCVRNDEFSKLENHFMLYSMKQMVKEPTRVTTSSSSIIDHMWISDDLLIRGVKVPKIGLSDHFPTCISISGRFRGGNMHKVISYRSYKNFDGIAFKQDLQTVHWSVLDMFDDPNDALALWHKMVMEVINKHAPIREKRIKRDWQPEWFTKEIRELMRKRDYNKAKKEYDLYRLYRNKCVALIRKAKQDHYTNLIETSATDTKKLWNHLKGLAPSKKSATITSMNINGNLSENPTKIADELNKFFVTVAERHSAKANGHGISNILNTLRLYVSRFSPDQFQIPQITICETECLIKELSSNKATGLDNIPPKLLKLGCVELAPSLTTIINLSLTSGIFPDMWKQARVSAVHKKGDVNDMENYRPISVLPITSKIIERHVHKHLYLHMHPMLHVSQSGFREGHSCETALINMLDQWTKSIDDGDLNAVIMLDLKKAFELINHELLLEKLLAYNVSELSSTWFKSYLQNRYQVVSLQNGLSDKLSVPSGVPQGSIIGPLLFIIFVNDLPLHLSASNIVDMYADDTTITTTGKCLDDVKGNVDTLVNEAESWCKGNCMALNMEKTKGMLITTRQKRRRLSKDEITTFSQRISLTDKHKVLGVIVDQDLTWNEHVQYVARRVSSYVALLRRIKQFLPIRVRRIFFMAYIQSCYDFCLSVWGASCHITRIEKLQKLAIRVVLDRPKRESSKPLFKEMHIMPMRTRVDFKQTLLVYKALNQLAPTYLQRMFLRKEQEKKTRSVTQGDLCIPKVRTKLRKMTLVVRGAELYNSCNRCVREADSVLKFKRNYICDFFKTF